MEMEENLSKARNMILSAFDIVVGATQQAGSTTPSSTPRVGVDSRNSTPRTCSSSSIAGPSGLSSSLGRLDSTTSPRSLPGIEERKRLFSYKYDGGKPRKARKKAASQSKLSQWTKDAFCLASSSATTVPEPKEKMLLAANSLGLKRLCFYLNGDAEHIASIIRLSYPRLQGSFDLMRTEKKSSELFVIQEPSEGLTVLSLKDIVGQAKLYVRPKVDINLTDQVQNYLF